MYTVLLPKREEDRSNMALATAARVAAPGPSMHTVAPVATGSTWTLKTASVSQKAIKKITCLGSGFVGGMEALLSTSVFSVG